MTILDKVKSFFKRAKPVAEVAKEKPPEAAIKKPTKTTQPRKKHPKPQGRRFQELESRKGLVRGTVSFKDLGLLVGSRLVTRR